MKQIHIAVCDDETADLAQTLDLVKQYDSAHQLCVTAFTCAEDVLQEAKKTGFEIVLMDIEMEPISGLDAARQLMGYSHPPVVIFTTKSSAYAMKGYGIALRYLQKPLLPQELSEALDIAIAEASAHRLTIQTDNVLHAILLRDVEYIEIFGHYATIHTPEKSYRLRSTLKELTAKLPQGYFISTHKSYIVNLEHIRSATATEALLNCGARLPISRTRQQAFNQAFYRFLGR